MFAPRIQVTGLRTRSVPSPVSSSDHIPDAVNQIGVVTRASDESVVASPTVQCVITCKPVDQCRWRWCRLRLSAALVPLIAPLVTAAVGAESTTSLVPNPSMNVARTRSNRPDCAAVTV